MITDYENKVNGIPIMPLLARYGIAFTGGKIIHCRPGNGSDSNLGNDFEHAVATLARAYVLATADQNDVVLLYSEDNSASGTTDYQSATLTWGKDLVHLIGVCPNTGIGQRARIAFTSTYDTASNLFTLSGNSCVIANVHMFAGVAGTNPTGCMNVTGDRNLIADCHIAGIGATTNDIANAYSLQLSGAEECVIRNCTIGVDTIGKGTAANSEIRLVSGATRCKFLNCDILTYADADTHQFLIKGSAGIDRWVQFVNCNFLNPVKSAATTMTEAFDVTAGGSPNGLILLKNCTLIGAADWEAGDEGEVYIDGAAPTAASSGIGVNTTA